ncbi:MAG: hypothetical protein HZC28_19815 [Spirochaetes bacterium]|nr:hypothetical protein [Spirochaetota bacterium]
MHEISDDTVKALISDYQIQRAHDCFMKLRDYLAPFMYHFPRKVFRKDHDEATAFYLYALERLETIVLSFEKKDYLFVTWFSVVLRNLYCNYLKRSRTHKRASVRTVAVDVHDNATHEVLFSIPETCADDEHEQLSDLEAYLSPRVPLRDVTMYKLHYLEVFKERIIIPLMELLKIDMRSALNIVEAARETYFDKCDSLMRLQDRITELHVKRRMHTAAGRLPYAQRLQKTADRLSQKISRIQPVVPYAFIAKTFAASVTAVTKIILKIKAVVRSFSKDFL